MRTAQSLAQCHCVWYVSSSELNLRELLNNIVYVLYIVQAGLLVNGGEPRGRLQALFEAPVTPECECVIVYSRCACLGTTVLM
jgi:hypothetical protein